MTEEYPPTIPLGEMRGKLWHAYGVDLMTVGEDGAWIALGHHSPRRMIAAIRKAARDQLGASNGTFDYCTASEALAAVTRGRALFTEPPEPFSDEDEWWAHWSADARAHPDAVDVTFWAE